MTQRSIAGRLAKVAPLRLILPRAGRSRMSAWFRTIVGMSEDINQTIALAVETSGARGSVLLARGQNILAADTFKVEQQHGVQLLPTVDALSKHAEVDPKTLQYIYVSGGPGSFTGLRIGITFAKTLAYALQCKVVRVPSLDVLAQNALALNPKPTRVMAILDAKRQRIYARTFELVEDRYEPLDEPDERDPLEYLAQYAPATVVGLGIERHREAVESVSGISIAEGDLHHGRAEWVLRLGSMLAAQNQFISLDELTPIYIRKPDAEEKWEARQAEKT
ncbi:MAG: tRNA (adenosine(37)-N6)-threonylcarbamoyltransferase complex dimerization subunit type 1 TsaB [Planctomycetes bacterium]|nr:tRNA (adenosine(37)-N6)-threonylcarbamoyltransferase complex dimerization subunit type 1 TsaB [Planctomycetota bacterium]